MILPALFFYLFAGVCVASAVMVIVSRNPVHSVLFLILAFVNASGLFVLLGAVAFVLIKIERVGQRSGIEVGAAVDAKAGRGGGNRAGHGNRVRSGSGD